MAKSKEDAIVGCLLGTAVGDAIGLPFERLTKARQWRLCPQLDGPSFLFGRGMVSDDTEHACLTAQALIASGGDPSEFEKCLASQLRTWFLCVAPGAGLATVKSCLRLCSGVPPQRSGVFSAGNGPAMRSPIIGASNGEDHSRLRKLVEISTRMTHNDPKATNGALAVALAAHLAASERDISPLGYYSALCELIDDAELLGLVQRCVEAAERGESVAEFAASLGLAKGVSGYMYHTVPIALYAWFRHPRDLRSAIIETVRCGGDTDSTGALAGAIVGAATGSEGIPQEWISALLEFPRSTSWMEKVAIRLAADNDPGQPIPLFLPAVMLRNSLFLAVVLGHAARRVFPPY